MVLHILAAMLLVLGMLCPAAGMAQGRAATVVELFTSQGCSSCPPADANLARLADEPGVIALALHVDYWDYLGWTDDFAMEKFSLRQRAYAEAMGLSSVYTPQVVVAGVAQGVGSDPAAVAALIKAQNKAPAADLQISRQGGTVLISATARSALAAPLVVQLVRYKPLAQVSIERGENAGRVIDYANIVTSWAKVGTWDGRGDLRLTVPAPGADAVVVILQEDGPGAIRAAAALD